MLANGREDVAELGLDVVDRLPSLFFVIQLTQRAGGFERLLDRRSNPPSCKFLPPSLHYKLGNGGRGVELLTVDQAAEWLNVSPRYIRRLLYERRLAKVNFGRHVRVPREALEDLVRQGYTPAKLV